MNSDEIVEIERIDWEYEPYNYCRISDDINHWGEGTECIVLKFAYRTRCEVYLNSVEPFVQLTQRSDINYFPVYIR